MACKLIGYIFISSFTTEIGGSLLTCTFEDTFKEILS